MVKAASEGVLNILTDLVSFSSVSGDFIPTEECFRYLRKYLTDRGLEASLLRSNDYPSIFASTQGSKKPMLLLQAHMDVVPATPEHFKLTERDGRLYGRGVFDMKFAAACYLQLIEELKDELDRYDFGLMLTADEEIGGQNGVGYLLEQGYSADVCLLPDGGDEWRIESTCNGVWLIKLVSNGKTAHGSRPWDGVNAIDNLVAGLSELKSLFGELEVGKNSVTVSQISGGQAINQVPDYAEATVDMRFVSQADMDKHCQAIELIAGGRGLQIETVARLKAGTLDMTDRRVIDFMVIAERVRGQPIGLNHSLGSTDSHYFAKKGIPAIVIRPHGGGHHSDEEWIDKAELLKFYEMLKAYVTETTKIA